jgi:hypothetical protein
MAVRYAKLVYGISAIAWFLFGTKIVHLLMQTVETLGSQSVLSYLLVIDVDLFRLTLLPISCLVACEILGLNPPSMRSLVFSGIFTCVLWVFFRVQYLTSEDAFDSFGEALVLVFGGIAMVWLSFSPPTIFEKSFSGLFKQRVKPKKP